MFSFPSTPTFAPQLILKSSFEKKVAEEATKDQRSETMVNQIDILYRKTPTHPSPNHPGNLMELMKERSKVNKQMIKDKIKLGREVFAFIIQLTRAPAIPTRGVQDREV